MQLFVFQYIYLPFNRDRILLSNQAESKILDDYYTYLDDLCVKMKELKKNLDNKELRMESNLTDAQKEHDLNKQKIVELQEKIGQLTTERDGIQEKLTDSDLIVQNIQSEFDALSLRTRIVGFFPYSKIAHKINNFILFMKVSYVSVFPLFILILAVMIAFYPVLATITATSL
jgi:ABC-type phosphate transport system auxiliary subunit